MSTIAATAGSRWIISPLYDSVFIVGTPFLSILFVFGLGTFVTGETLMAVVMALGATGHHVPGFLRTYGDPDLFERFKLRLLVIPPLLFSAVYLMTRNDLNGVGIVFLVWVTWHTLMQHYGFMRIYDAKVGAFSPVTARLDWVVSIAGFILMTALSPLETGAFLSHIYAYGIPYMEAGTFHAIRVATIAVCLAGCIAWAGHTAWQVARGRPVSPIKVTLTLTTMGLLYFAQVITSDPIVALLLFEIFHDLQYDALVWAYNRKLVEKAGTRKSRFMQVLFRRKGSMLLLYVGIILAYGGMSLPWLWDQQGDLYTVAKSFFITSALLHFYYDGFIWKIGKPDTRQGLDLERSDDARAAGAPPPALRGAFDCALQVLLVVLPIGLVGYLELRHPKPELERLQVVASQVPESPKVRLDYGKALAKSGFQDRAIDEFREALRLNPEQTKEQLALADALSQRGEYRESLGIYQEVLQDFPGEANALTGKALAISVFGDPHAAREILLDVVARNPGLAKARIVLGFVCGMLQEPEKALEHLTVAQSLEPRGMLIRMKRAELLLELGRGRNALDSLRRALEVDPYFAPLHFAYAETLIVESGDVQLARHHLEEAERLDPAFAEDVEAALRALP